MAHYVYLISNERRMLKIGHSNDPLKRIANLATSSPEKLEIAHTWAFGERDVAVAFEAAMHSLFRFSRVRREWHEAGVDEVVALGDMLVRDDEAQAAEIAAVLAEAMTHWREYRRLKTERDGLNRRWKRDERVRLSDAAYAAEQQWSDAWSRAYGLGLPEPEWLALVGS